MFALTLERGKFLRIRAATDRGEVEKLFSCPVNGAFFVGAIIALPQRPMSTYRAAVGDTYESIAAEYGVDAEELSRLNGNKTVYPTAKIYLPCQ